MKRHEDWPKRLDLAIEAARGRLFCWGQHDCALFAANVVQQLTGIDYATSWRGTYSTALEAKRRLGDAGGLLQVVTDALGTPIPAAQASRGDVVALQTENGPAIGICVGIDAAFPGESRLMFVRTDRCLQAWRV